MTAEQPPETPSDPGSPEPGAPGGRWRHRRGSRRLWLSIGAGATAAVMAGAVAVAVISPWSDDQSSVSAGPPTPTASPAGPSASADPGGDSNSHGDPPDEDEAPGGSDFPNADTTGVVDESALTPSDGLVVGENGTVIENLLIVDGEIEVQANDVTIRNVRVTNDREFVQWGIHQAEGASGLTVEDSEIFGSAESDQQFASAISNHGGVLTVRRVEVHTITDGIVTRHGLIEDSYLHSPRLFPEDHTDMVQANGGPADGLGLEIRNNTIINDFDQTAAIFLQPETGNEQIPVQNVSIEGNYLAGGGYTIYGGGLLEDGDEPANIVIRDNIISQEVYPDGGRYGPSAYFDESAPGSEWTNNVWESDGSPVEPGSQG